MSESFSLGLWIVSREAVAWGKPECEYRGLDRRPELPGPDQDDDLRGRGRDRLIGIRDELWNLEDTRELHRSPEAALRLREALEAEGFPVEIVLARVVPPRDLSDLPQDLRSAYEDRRRRWAIGTPATGVGTQPLGMDVTYPFPTFHSAIRQPTLGAVAPELVGELNEFGLLPTLEVASEVAHRGNRRDTSWRPLCAAEISLVEPRP